MGIFSSIVSGVASVGSSILQNSAQKKMQEKEFEYNKEMWNLANQYNSPEMQMQRLKDAGLNPNLVYGNGAVGNTSTQTPKYQAPGLQRVPLEMISPLQVLGAFADLKQKNAMADKAKTESQYIEAEMQEKIKSNILANAQISSILGKDINAIKRTKQFGWSSVGDSNLFLEQAKSNLGKSQAEVKSRLQDVDLKNFTLEFMKTIPKSMQWALPLFFNAIRSVK